MARRMFCQWEHLPPLNPWEVINRLRYRRPPSHAFIRLLPFPNYIVLISRARLRKVNRRCTIRTGSHLFRRIRTLQRRNTKNILTLIRTQPIRRKIHLACVATRLLPRIVSISRRVLLTRMTRVLLRLVRNLITVPKLDNRRKKSWYGPILMI